MHKQRTSVFPPSRTLAFALSATLALGIVLGCVSEREARLPAEQAVPSQLAFDWRGTSLSPSELSELELSAADLRTEFESRFRGRQLSEAERARLRNLDIKTSRSAQSDGDLIGEVRELRMERLRDGRFAVLPEANEQTNAGTMRPMRLAFPDDATGALRVEHLETGLGLEIRLENAQTSPLSLSKDSAIYRDALGKDAHLLRRALQAGAEDYFLFAQKPPQESVGYSIDVSSFAAVRQVAGANNLEFLDAHGVVRMAMQAPFLIDANHTRHSAELQVSGCEVDRDPRHPRDRSLTRFTGTSCQVRIDWSKSGARYPIVLDPSWIDGGSMRSPRQGHIAEVLADGRVLVAGGFEAGWFDTSTLVTSELYDPSTRTWATTGSISKPRNLAIGVKLPSGEVFLAGGNTMFIWGPERSSSEQYNPATGTWTARAGMNFGRSRGRGTLLPDGRVLLDGGLGCRVPSPGNDTHGCAGGLPSSEQASFQSEIYDPTANTVTPIAGLHVNGRDDHALVPISGNRVLAFGTNTATGITSEILNVATGIWSLTGNVPWSGSMAYEVIPAIALNDGRVFTVEGYSNGATNINETALFNPTTNTWAAGPAIAVADWGFVGNEASTSIAVKTADGNIVIAGGQGKPAYRYNVSANTFTPYTTNNSAYDHGFGTLSLLNNGQILLTGGGTGAIGYSELLVQCTSNSDCSGGTPLCNTSTNICSQCLSAATCNDNIACTTDSCTAGLCVNSSNAAGTACTGGVCNGSTTAPACVACTTGAHCNDGNACTSDVCTSNVCSNPSLTSGSACAGGVCNGATTNPICVQCLNDTQCGGATPRCNTTTNLCTACSTGAHCADGNPCTDDLCTTGVCSNPNTSAGTNCGGANVCNGFGMCVGCANDTQCGGSTPFCVTGACVGCRNATDCNDGNACTVDGCVSGTCQRITQATGTPCAGGVCNGNTATPICVECTNNTHCTGGLLCDTATNTCDRDSDGDGVRDSVDLDDDNDGIPDLIEGNTDFDADGIANHLDLDSDGDGLSDLMEGGGIDSNGDGRVDNFVDSNQNGLDSMVDPTEGGTALPLPNTDGTDGPDYLDLDSDADGLFDRFEIHDRNGDGVRDVLPSGNDSNANGLDDAYDPAAGGMAVVAANHGGTAIPDYRNPDDDGDGIPTAQEAADANNDGNPSDALNTDGDLNPNYLDNDDDGDGILTATERADGQALTPPRDDLPTPDEDSDPHWLDTDSDGDGALDMAEGRGDIDGDGIPNYLDSNSAPQDTDMDGLRDDEECPGAANCRDTDMDGMPDWNDPDDDGDGVLTKFETPNGDTDGDLVLDYLDTDDDGDTILTKDEAPDANGDGNPADAANTDGDSRPNYLDNDDDNDGIPTATERRDGLALSPPADDLGNPDEDSDPHWLDLDSDGDMLTDAQECASPSMCADTNGNGVPDYLEPLDSSGDRDGDGLSDNTECPGGTNCRDTDMDGTPDIDDRDDDGDGIFTAQERPNGMNRDTDMDGSPDHLDNDDDGDTLLTKDEAPDANGDGLPSDARDSDADGKPDYLDEDDDNDTLLTKDEVADSKTAPVVAAFSDPTDVDGDGKLNWLDTDADDDTLLDRNEGRGDSNGNGIPNYLEGRVRAPGGLVGGGAYCAMSVGSSHESYLGIAFAMLGLGRTIRRRNRSRKMQSSSER